MRYLLYILPPISFIMGIWRIVYAIKHCHDPDFAIQLVLGFFLILASIVFFFCNCNIVTWNFDTIPQRDMELKSKRHKRRKLK